MEMADLMDAAADEEWNSEHLKPYFSGVLDRLVEMAGAYGFSGNLWHDYLTLLLVNHENAFSTACEIPGAGGSIQELARHDFEIFRKLYAFDLTAFDRLFHHRDAAVIKICSLQAAEDTGKMFNRRVRDRIC